MNKFIGINLFLIFSLISVVTFSAPLSGVYTIGGSSPSYATLAEAASALNTNGINGPVTFNIRPGTYTEQIVINKTTGASTNSRVVFQSETGIASDVIITYAGTSTNNYIIYLNGACYLTFKNLTVEATDMVYAKAIVLKNGSTNDSIVNDILNCPLVNWDDYDSMVIDASPNGTANDSIAVIGNQINGGSFGYETEGYGNREARGLVIANNVWTNQTYMAVDIGNVDNAIIQNNIMVANVNGARFGIIVWNGCDQVRILNNKIYGVQSQGLYIPSAGVAGREGLIANNFISVSGIGIEGINTTYQHFYNNSIEAGSYLVYMLGGCSNNVLKNNIFYSSSGSSFMSISPDIAISESDYNDFYTTGPFGDWNGTSCTDLASWIATSGMDSNSKFIQPAFTSDSDLHLISYTGMNFGTPLSEVPEDIDGDVRSLVTPVVGADEGASAAKVRFTANITTVCSGGMVNFTDQSTNSPSAWKWTFNGGYPGVSGAQNPSVTYNIAGTFDVKLVVTDVSGKDSLIKTGYIKVNPSPVAGTITGNPDSVCSGSSLQLNAIGNSGNIQWQSSLDGASYSDIAFATNATYNTPNLSQTTYYRVAASNNCGIDSSVGQKITVIALPSAGTISSIKDTICEGTVAHLSVTGSTGNVQWQSAINLGNYSNISGGTNTSYSPIINESTYFRVYASNGNCSDTSSELMIVAKPAPIAAFTDTANGLELTFNSGGSISATSYLWNFGDSSTTNDVNPVHVFSKPSTYHVCLTVYNSTNCNSTVCNNIEVVTTGITGFENDKHLVIYPNPFTSNFYLNTAQNNFTGEIKIYDVTGRILKEDRLINSPGILDFDLHNLLPGVYYVGVKTGTINYVQKVVKE